MCRVRARTAAAVKRDALDRLTLHVTGRRRVPCVACGGPAYVGAGPNACQACKTGALIDGTGVEARELLIKLIKNAPKPPHNKRSHTA